MLSDEEKAVLKTAKENYGLTSAEQKILVNLIEKLSKEIEELKMQLEVEKIDNKYNQEEASEEMIPRYKIKAKIEEVSNGTYDAKIVLQSLLEKE